MGALDGFVPYEAPKGHPMLYAAEYGIYINREALRSLGNPEYISFHFHETEPMIAIMAEKEKSCHAARVNKASSNGRIRYFTKGLMRKVEETAGRCKIGRRFKAMGKPMQQGDARYIIFDLRRAKRI